MPNSSAGFPAVAEAVDHVLRGLDTADPGFDGEYGAVHVAAHGDRTAPVA